MVIAPDMLILPRTLVVLAENSVNKGIVYESGGCTKS